MGAPKRTRTQYQCSLLLCVQRVRTWLLNVYYNTTHTLTHKNSIVCVILLCTIVFIVTSRKCRRSAARWYDSPAVSKYSFVVLRGRHSSAAATNGSGTHTHTSQSKHFYKRNLATVTTMTTTALNRFAFAGVRWLHRQIIRRQQGRWEGARILRVDTRKCYEKFLRGWRVNVFKSRKRSLLSYSNAT